MPPFLAPTVGPVMYYRLSGCALVWLAVAFAGLDEGQDPLAAHGSILRDFFTRDKNAGPVGQDRQRVSVCPSYSGGW